MFQLVCSVHSLDSLAGLVEITLNPSCVEKGRPPWLREQQAVLGQWGQCWHDVSSVGLMLSRSAT